MQLHRSYIKIYLNFFADGLDAHVEHVLTPDAILVNTLSRRVYQSRTVQLPLKEVLVVEDHDVGSRVPAGNTNIGNPEVSHLSM